MITDDEYIQMQGQVQLASQVLLGVDPEALGEFILRAERAESVGLILNPSEWMEAAPKLRQVIVCANALWDARCAIAGVAP